MEVNSVRFNCKGITFSESENNASVISGFDLDCIFFKRVCLSQNQRTIFM